MQQLRWETVPKTGLLEDVSTCLPTNLEIRPKPISFGQFNSKATVGKPLTFKIAAFQATGAGLRLPRKLRNGELATREKQLFSPARAILNNESQCSVSLL